MSSGNTTQQSGQQQLQQQQQVTAPAPQATAATTQGSGAQGAATAQQTNSPAAAFFEEIRELNDGAPKQLANLETQIEKAAASGNEDLVLWANEMSSALDHALDGHQAAAPSGGGGFLDSLGFGNIIEGFKAAMAAFSSAEGNIIERFQSAMQAFNSVSNPGQEHMAAAQQDLEDADAALDAVDDQTLESVFGQKRDQVEEIAQKGIDKLPTLKMS